MVHIIYRSNSMTIIEKLAIVYYCNKLYIIQILEEEKNLRPFATVKLNVSHHSIVVLFPVTLLVPATTLVKLTLEALSRGKPPHQCFHLNKTRHDFIM